MQMEIRQLEFAVRLAETLHFGKAAASEFISQPAFSVQIARLENELGCVLFERTNHRVLLTEAGQHFVERAQSILRQIYDTSYETKRIFENKSVIRVGFFGEGAGELTHLVFDSFLHSSPETEIHAVELTMVNQVSAVINNEVDLAFMRTPILDSRLELIPLFEEPLVAVVSNKSELSDAKELSIEDLLDQPFAVAAEGAPREWASFWSLDENRGSPSRVGGTVKTIYESLSTVAYCNAVDTYPATATRQYSHPGVTYVPLRDAPFSQLSIATVKDKPNNELINLLKQNAIHISQEMISAVPQARLPSPQ